MKINIVYIDGTEESYHGNIDFNDPVTAQFTFRPAESNDIVTLTIPWVAIKKIEITD